TASGSRSVRNTAAAATPERASASACTAASALRARCWSTALVCARPTASTLSTASPATAARRATPRSPRRDTHHLHQLARLTGLPRDPHPHLAQPRVRGRRRVPGVAERARPLALDVAGRGRVHLGFGEEG